jgi:hypothetical protein
VKYLGLDDGEGSERATSVSIRHFRSTLQQTGVEVEHISRVGLTTGRSTQQQGHLSVGHSLLRQIVVDDQGVFTFKSGVTFRDSVFIKIKFGNSRSFRHRVKI